MIISGKLVRCKEEAHKGPVNCLKYTDCLENVRIDNSLEFVDFVLSWGGWLPSPVGCISSTSSIDQSI